MKISSIRLGHATNSSSSHSVVIVDKPIKDSFALDGDCQFGWADFVLASSRGKMEYLATMICQNLQPVLGDDMARMIASQWITQIPEDAYIDHQSEWYLPRGKERKGLNLEFINDLRTFLARDDVVVQGGNDNVDEYPESLGRDANLPLKSDVLKHCIARPDGPYWVLYNYETGAKIRFSFYEDVAPYIKASAPELVDLKITDFCEQDCGWCYQGATSKGKHANHDTLSRIVYALGHMGVFEIALGGGDTFAYPKLKEIMETAQWSGITPNFTTHRIDWLDTKDAEHILEMCGGWGYSVRDTEQIRKLHEALHKNRLPNKTTLHIVPDLSYSEQTLAELLRVAIYNDFPVLLLGYKKSGRGATYKYAKSIDWLSVIKTLEDQHIYGQVSIDTALASQWKDKIEEAKIPRMLYETDEGKFSCYIDAVSERIGPCSYGGRVMTQPLEWTDGEGYGPSIIENFAGF